MACVIKSCSDLGQAARYAGKAQVPEDLTLSHPRGNYGRIRTPRQILSGYLDEAMGVEHLSNATQPGSCNTVLKEINKTDEWHGCRGSFPMPDAISPEMAIEHWSGIPSSRFWNCGS